MSALRIILCAAGALLGLANAAAAQVPATPDQSVLMGGHEFGQPVMDQETFAHFILNQNEGRLGRLDGIDTHYRWSGQGWVGTDYDKLWIRTEGTVKKGAVEDGQHEFLYSRAISPYFDLQGGLRTDLDSRRTRNWAAFGIQGLAPYFFEIEAAGYVSPQGHLAARFEVAHDLLITNRLILQPQVEFNFYSKSDPGRGNGAGLSEIDAGLRLRYEFSRKFAPYIGVSYEGKFGQTAKFARQAGDSTGDVRFVAGVRVWF
jgi:copper resistance protein B